MKTKTTNYNHKNASQNQQCITYHEIVHRPDGVANNDGDLWHRGTAERCHHASLALELVPKQCCNMVDRSLSSLHSKPSFSLDFQLFVPQSFRIFPSCSSISITGELTTCLCVCVWGGVCACVCESMCVHVHVCVCVRAHAHACFLSLILVRVLAYC